MGTVATAKVTFSEYRSPYHGDSLAWDRSHNYNEHCDEVWKRTLNLTGIELRSYAVLSLFKLHPAVYDEIRKVYKASVGTRNRNPRTINIDKFFLAANALMDSRVSVNKVLGLCAVTGRCTVEIMKTGIFHTSENEMCADFEGQVKTRDSEACGIYQIPLLMDYDRVVAEMAVARAANPKWADMSNEEIDQRYRSQLSTSMGFFRMLIGETTLSPKILRKLYAAIAYKIYGCGQNQTRFFADVLGHSFSDNDTALFYIKYEME